MQESVDYNLTRYMISRAAEEGETEYVTLSDVLERVMEFYRDHPTYNYFGIEAVNDIDGGAYAIIWYGANDA